MRTLAVFCLSALLLTGCSGFSLKSSAPPLALYTLHAAGAPAAARAKQVIAIAEPDVPPGFESDRIAILLDQGRRQDYAAGAAWPAPFPKVLQDFLVRSGNAVEGLMAVTLDSGLPARYKLLVKVNDFEPVYAADAKAPPLLKVSMTFTLQPLDKNVISASFTLAEDRPASANSLTAITGGLESIAQDIVAQGFARILMPHLKAR